MKQLRKALVDLEVGDEELLRRLTQNGETPDIVLAALLKIFDFYLVLSVFDEFNGIVDRPWLYELSGEAFDRVFELVAEASGEDTKEVKAMLYRSVIQHASGKIAEIYS